MGFLNVLTCKIEIHLLYSRKTELCAQFRIYISKEQGGEKTNNKQTVRALFLKRESEGRRRNPWKQISI